MTWQLLGNTKLSLTVENFLLCSFVHSYHAIRMMHHVLYVPLPNVHHLIPRIADSDKDAT
jgi:hypothetical protein